MINKYWISLLVICLGMLPLQGQIVVNMEQDGGVYKVPCSVNGVKMKFIFDTGASAVSLSKSMATFMEDNGFLNKSDYLGKTQVHIADGSIVDVDVVNLRDFEIGGLHLQDVIATIKDGQNVPLLMGQSAIEKLGRVSIEKGRLLIHQASTTLSLKQIATLRAEIEKHALNSEHESVIQKISELRRGTQLTGSDYFYYVQSLFGIHDFEQCIAAGKDWEAADIDTDDFDKEAIYSSMASAYSIVGEYNNAILYYQKAFPLCDPFFAGSTLAQIASCYYDLNNKSQTESYLKQAVRTHYAYLNHNSDSILTVADVLAGDIEDYQLGYIYWEYASFEEKFNHDYSQRDFYLRLSAKCGWQQAIDFCFKNNINYTK